VTRWHLSPLSKTCWHIPHYAGPSSKVPSASSRRASSAMGSSRHPSARNHPRRTLSDEGEDFGYTDAPYYSFRPRARRRLLPRLNPRNIRAGRLVKSSENTLSPPCPITRVHFASRCQHSPHSTDPHHRPKTVEKLFACNERNCLSTFSLSSN
jgi:hypothetical protein